MRPALLTTLATVAALSLAAPALAGQPVELRAGAVGHAGVVTLGDLFDGAQGAAAARVVGRAHAGQEAVLDAGEVQLAARSVGLDWANSAGQRRIIVEVDAGPADGAPGPGRHARRRARGASVLVYSRNITAGEVVQASDLQWSEEAVAGPDAPNAADAVIGLAARLPLHEGSAVSAHDLVAPKVIRRDQMIAVDFSEGGVSLSLTAKAMGDAAVGDVVSVMNVSSKKVLQAVATGAGHAAIGEAADAAARTSPLQTAAN